MSGTMAFTGPIWRFLGINTGTMWALLNWAWLVDLSRQTAHTALAALGVDGFGAIFDLAVVSSQRILNEFVGISVTAPLSSVADSFIGALSAFIILIGLSVPGLVAAVAEVELLLGSAIAPLILPFLAIGWMRPIGFGVIQWQISAVLRIVALGVISNLIAGEVSRITLLPGMDEAFRLESIQQLTILSVLSVMLSIAAGSIASAITRGMPGVMGSTSIRNAVSHIGGGVSGAANYASRAASGVSSAMGGGGAGAGSRGRTSTAGSGGSVGRASAGSAFQ